MGAAVVATLTASGLGTPTAAQAPGTPFNKLAVPKGVPAWFLSHWHAMLNAPLPSLVVPTPNLPASIPATTTDADPAGATGTYQPNGATATATNAFFQPLGTNGRACITCHLPANGMSISLDAIKAQYNSSGVNNPLFAPVDAATCPLNVPTSSKGPSPVNAANSGTPVSNLSAYVLLLTKGLFRIPLPVPANADFTISVTSDPYGCNTNSQYNQVVDASTGAVSRILSVYRRPLMSANLKFKTMTVSSTGLFPSTGLTTDPFTGLPESGNIMWDGREGTLQSQAIDATLGHAQALTAPTTAQVNQIVAFETGIFAAQTYDTKALSLTSGAVAPGLANGGPVIVANTSPATTVPGDGKPTFVLYAQPSTTATSALDQSRASIVRDRPCSTARSSRSTTSPA